MTKSRLILFFIIAQTILFASCSRVKHSLTGPEHYYFGSYSEGERFYNEGDYKKAIQKYESYLNENPEGNLAVIAQYYIGRSYSAMGKTEDAKKTFEKIVEKYPGLVWANFAQNQLKELELHTAAPKK